ncbi:MAG: hypothetical protein QXU13_06120 [Desulfurococcaceae archaeon]
MDLKIFVDNNVVVHVVVVNAINDVPRVKAFHDNSRNTICPWILIFLINFIFVHGCIQGLPPSPLDFGIHMASWMAVELNGMGPISRSITDTSAGFCIAVRNEGCNYLAMPRVFCHKYSGILHMVSSNRHGKENKGD